MRCRSYPIWASQLPSPLWRVVAAQARGVVLGVIAGIHPTLDAFRVVGTKSAPATVARLATGVAPGVTAATPRSTVGFRVAASGNRSTLRDPNRHQGPLQQGEEHRAGRRDDVAAAMPRQDFSRRLRRGQHVRQHGLGCPGFMDFAIPAPNAPEAFMRGAVRRIRHSDNDLRNGLACYRRRV